MERFLPYFDDLDAERRRISDEVFSSIGNLPTFDSGAEEAAYVLIDTHLSDFREMRSVYLTTCVAGLFHLFERQLMRHLAREFRGWELSGTAGKPYRIDRWERIEEIVNQLCDGVDVEGQTLVEAFNDPDLQELKEVANASKHGEGRATIKLREMKAVVVDSGRIQHDFTAGRHSNIGIPISVTMEDILRYKESILRFWGVRGSFYPADEA